MGWGVRHTPNNIYEDWQCLGLVGSFMSPLLMFETLHRKNMCHGGFVGKSDAPKTGLNVKVVVFVTHRFL